GRRPHEGRPAAPGGHTPAARRGVGRPGARRRIRVQDLMITRFGRAVVARSVTPVARLLLRAGVPATAVTVVGGLLAVVAAAVLVPTGHTVAAAVTLGVLTVLDSLDGV